MELQSLIRDLEVEKHRVDRAIAAVESLASSEPAKRRGRKSMGEAERQQVAERMRRYWESRRKGS